MGTFGAGPSRTGRLSWTGRSTESDFGRAVSRILSSPKTFGGENHLSEQPVPGTRSALRNLQRAAAWSPIWPCTRWGFPCLRACAWSGGLLLHLFTLTPPKRGGLFSVALSVGKSLDMPPACIHFVDAKRLRGIAPFGVRTFLLCQRFRATEAILRPSKIVSIIQYCGTKSSRWTYHPSSRV